MWGFPTTFDSLHIGYGFDASNHSSGQMFASMSQQWRKITLRESGEFPQQERSDMLLVSYDQLQTDHNWTCTTFRSHQNPWISIKNSHMQSHRYLPFTVDGAPIHPVLLQLLSRIETRCFDGCQPDVCVLVGLGHCVQWFSGLCLVMSKWATRWGLSSNQSCLTSGIIYLFTVMGTV